MTKQKKDNSLISILFIVIPIIFTIIGIIFFPYNASSNKTDLISTIPLFSGLALLFIGYITNKKLYFSNYIKTTGWILFAFYWSIQINPLYYGADGDLVNAIICIAGIFLLSYIAYHEWLCYNKKDEITCLNWMAGAASIAGIIYFIMEITPLAYILREIVAAQSGQLLNIFTGKVYVDGLDIYYKFTRIRIIFACTAVQSMVIFVGMILPIASINLKRKMIGLAVTVIPVYFLNLIRNALVTYLVGENLTDFNMAHNVIGKGGSLIALIILLFIVIKIIPEVFDEINCLLDLPKRNGPIEKTLKKIL